VSRAANWGLLSAVLRGPRQPGPTAVGECTMSPPACVIGAGELSARWPKNALGRDLDAVEMVVPREGKPFGVIHTRYDLFLGFFLSRKWRVKTQ